MTRRRVWLNTPYHNYNDRYKLELSSGNIEEFTLYTEDNIHFNYGDFYNTSCISVINGVVSNIPNYMVLYNNEGNIDSHWFVMEYAYISGDPKMKSSKYQVTLLRDVCVDFKDTIKNELFSVKRGNLLKERWNPLLVTPEGFMISEVKKEQRNIELWDKDTEWLTIFYDHTATEEQRTINLTSIEYGNYDYTFDEMFTEYDEKGFTLSLDEVNNNIVERDWNNVSVILRWEQNNTPSLWLNTLCTIAYNRVSYTLLEYSNSMTSTTANNILSLMNATLYSVYQPINTSATNDYHLDKVVEFYQLRNQYNQSVIINNVDYYRPNIVLENGYATSTSSISSELNTSIERVFNSIHILSGQSNYTVREFIAKSVNLWSVNSTTEFNDIEPTIKMILPQSSLDEIFLGCVTIPIGGTLKKDDNLYHISKEQAIALASSGWASGGSLIKDIQLLPYCPSSVLNINNLNNEASDIIEITNIGEHYQVPITNVNSSKVIYYAITCHQSSLSYNYPFDLSEWFTNDVKLDSITKKCRIMSHNHAQAFEFNPSLDVDIHTLSISYTIRPFDTTFRICPVFSDNGLYGGNYKDSRGLIYSGGFSLSQVTDAWVEYQLQNSTYKEVFNRDIQHLEVSHSTSNAQETLSYETAYANAKSSINAQIAKTAVSGIFAIGSGGGIGSVIGGASAINSAVNITSSSAIAERNYESAKQSQVLNDTQRAEDMSYKIDQFQLNNRAIQNQPTTVSQNSDYTVINNNKCYLELYDCTDEEKDFIRHTLQYHGMRFDAIGNINQYLVDDLDYIEGTFLFLHGLMPTISNAINNEFSRGAYIQGGLYHHD